MKTVLKLGTRRSLLAWAQSGWVARQIENLHPNIRVELVGIDTEGDRITDRPLSQMEGKDFFVKELDHALLSKRSDFSVHSLKDLSLLRPDGIRLGSIPARENPRDALIFHSRTLERLRRGEEIRIGTSAPRRLENLPPFLRMALPQFGNQGPRLRFVEIRGNVNTRLSRLHEADGTDRQLDGVCLALAGLNRLSRDSAARTELLPLIEGTRWMILPLTHCPSAPGQGALAVECRSGDNDTFGILQSLHHEPTARQIERERKILERWGGGCHQRFGATSVEHFSLGSLLYVRGRSPSGQELDTLEWDAPSPPSSEAIRPWDGVCYRRESTRTITLPANKDFLSSLHDDSALLISHARASSDEIAAQISRSNVHVWTPGASTWFRLAAQGVWVEGCCEGLGDSTLEEMIQTSPVLNLPPWKSWTVLTHGGAREKPEQGPLQIAAYRIETSNETDEEPAGLSSATHIFWGSASQFESLKKYANPHAHHAGGPGKTAIVLKRAGLNRWNVFPNPEEWRKWLRIH